RSKRDWSSAVCSSDLHEFDLCGQECAPGPYRRPEYEHHGDHTDANEPGSSIACRPQTSEDDADRGCASPKGPCPKRGYRPRETRSEERRVGKEGSATG